MIDCLDAIYSRNNVFIFNEHIKIVSTRNNGMWIHIIPEYGIISSHNDYSQSIINIYDKFESIYNCVALEKDENLTQNEIKLKRKILDDIKNVEKRQFYITIKGVDNE